MMQNKENWVDTVFSRTGLLRWLGLAVLLFAAPLQAHEGHDHGEAPAPLPVGESGPRFAVASDLFELVGTLHDHTLTLYLDDYASNAPVAGAGVELEFGPHKYQAKETEPGVYQLDLPAPQPGRHALLFTLQAGENSDLLTANLEIPPPGPKAAPAAAGFDPRWLAGLGVPLLGFWGWRWMRRRKSHD